MVRGSWRPRLARDAPYGGRLTRGNYAPRGWLLVRRAGWWLTQCQLCQANTRHITRRVPRVKASRAEARFSRAGGEMEERERCDQPAAPLAGGTDVVELARRRGDRGRLIHRTLLAQDLFDSAALLGEIPHGELVQKALVLAVANPGPGREGRFLL